MRLPLIARFSPPLLVRRQQLVTMSAAPNKLAPQPDLLGDEMKQYEADTCASTVDLSQPLVVRLDGHCFSTFTKGFDRPYDLRIHRAMVGTAGDLLSKFGAVTAYTESDEISLIFHPHSDDMPSTLPFNGRVQKVVSVFAGYASARFNFHMLRESFDHESRSSSSKSGTQAALRARVEESSAHFDARVFALPSLERLIAYVRWRAVLDCKRNSISMLSQAHFSQKVGKQTLGDKPLTSSKANLALNTSSLDSLHHTNRSCTGSMQARASACCVSARACGGKRLHHSLDMALLSRRKNTRSLPSTRRRSRLSSPDARGWHHVHSLIVT